MTASATASVAAFMLPGMATRVADAVPVSDGLGACVGDSVGVGDGDGDCNDDGVSDGHGDDVNDGRGDDVNNGNARGRPAPIQAGMESLFLRR